MSLKKTTNQAEALTQAHVVLMESEVISRGRTPDAFRLVNNQYNALQNWHDQHTGWRIRRTPAVIRLIRTPTAFIPGYVFRTLQHPRDFGCFVWALWYAETRLSSGRGNEQQFLMSQLADHLEEHSANGYLAPHIAPLDFKRQSDRFSLARALKALQELGGLQLVDGSSEEWVNQNGQENALWEFNEASRSLILALDMHDVTQAGKILDGNPYTLHPARLPGAERLNPLQRAWRTLLLGPVLLKYDDAGAFAALQEHQETLNFELGATFGWQLDLRHEYAMVIRASGTGQGPVTLLNLTGATDQAALLCCDVIRRRVAAGEWPYRAVEGCFGVPESELAEIFRELREQFGQRWGSTARKTSFQELLREVYATMRQAGLLRGPDRQGNVLVLPTVARFAVSYQAELDETRTEPDNNQPAQLDLNLEPAQPAVKLDLDPDATYSASQVARKLGVSDQSVSNWLKNGSIKGERLSQGWAIGAAEVERMARLRGGQPTVAPAPTPSKPAEAVRLPTAKGAPGQLYSAPQVAATLGVAGWTVLRWIQEGRLKASREGKNWFIEAAEVERLGQERQHGPTKPTAP